MVVAKLEIEKFTGSNDFSLWRLKIKAILLHRGLDVALSAENLQKIEEKQRPEVLKAHSTILLSLRDVVL